MGPWDHLTDEEKLENGDYQNELRWGGSNMTDDEIKQAVYDQDDWDLEHDYEHDYGSY